MRTATVDDLLSWGPCYSDREVRELAGEVTTFTALDVLRRDDIPPDDRLWVVLRTQLIDDVTMRLFACDCAEHVLPIWEKAHPQDDRPKRAIEIARKYAHGEASKAEMIAAGNEAWDAAGCMVAYSVAYAACGVARSFATAWSVARDAAQAAACAEEDWCDEVTESTEHNWQVQHLIEILT